MTEVETQENTPALTSAPKERKETQVDAEPQLLSWSTDIVAPIAIACLFATGLSTQRMAFGLVFISLGGFGYVLWMLALFVPVFLGQKAV